MDVERDEHILAIEFQDFVETRLSSVLPRFIVVEFWGISRVCVRLRARSVRGGGGGGTRLHAIRIVVATLYASLLPLQRRNPLITRLFARIIRVISEEAVPRVELLRARARLFLPLFFSEDREKSAHARYEVWLIVP